MSVDGAQKLALMVAELMVAVEHLRLEIASLRREVLDCKDVYRNCACFGIDRTEVP